jgi:hypothetical protein
MRVVIGSCAAYAKDTLPMILSDVSHLEGVTSLSVHGTAQPHGLGELDFLVDLASMGDDCPDITLFLMDTCRLLPRFQNTLNRMLDIIKYQDSDLCGFRSDIMPCFMGLYRKDFILRNASRFSEFANLSKRGKIEMEISGWMNSMASNYTHIPNTETWGPQERIYGSLRWRRSWSCGIIKYSIHRSLTELEPENCRNLPEPQGENPNILPELAGTKKQ